MALILRGNCSNELRSKVLNSCLKVSNWASIAGFGLDLWAVSRLAICDVSSSMR